MRIVLEQMKTKGTLSYIVVHECHCVDMWGFDFRPAYGELGVLSKLNCPIVVTLTATCTSRTEKVIISSLQLIDPVTIRQTCNRENIFLFVKQKKGDGKDQVVAEILKKYQSCGIVYCLQQNYTTDMAYLLQTTGINATYYHGALDPYKKKENF